MDNTKKVQLFLNGLGLLKGCVISAHFSKWNEEQHLKSAMEKTGVPIGYGIDDDGWIYLENEHVVKSDSKNYYIFRRN